MEFIKGYKYTNEQDVINAVKNCNDYYGILESTNNVTQNWVEYNTAIYDSPIFYYIIFDESLLVVLGNPIEFEIKNN